jgi:hypothetical protein
MISNQSRTKEWIMQARTASPGKDPILIEKMILALTLVENLRLAGLDFIFKGGTSLFLLLDRPHRFSIDIDIVLPEDRNPDKYLQATLGFGAFHRFEESKRPGDLPKQHYKFFFNSALQERESYILLDILYQQNPYPQLQEVDIRSQLISVENGITQVFCPTREGLLGDKLTAFAPNTTGIPYGKNKELEIAKQLFDIAVLFDDVTQIRPVAEAFNNIVTKELMYRDLRELTPEDVLLDAFYTAVVVGTHGASSKTGYAELLEGFKKLAAYIYSGLFTLDSAILCASKAAYLSALLVTQADTIDKYNRDSNLSDLSVVNPDYNKFNKLKKTNIEAFYYFYQALTRLELSGS